MAVKWVEAHLSTANVLAGWSQLSYRGENKVSSLQLQNKQ